VSDAKSRPKSVVLLAPVVNGLPIDPHDASRAGRRLVVAGLQVDVWMVAAFNGGALNRGLACRR
jgi:hypothetical protein